MFDRYLNKPEATAKEFYMDERRGQFWFKTGDCAVRDNEGVYKILGRLSADIIKKGGYKLSALEIESVLLTHAGVNEACVLGMPDPKYGDEIAALIVGSDGVGSEELQEFCKE